jgi:diguanylate cyclase (GGDEF)-like protein
MTRPIDKQKTARPVILANLLVRILTYGYGAFISYFALKAQGAPVWPLAVFAAWTAVWVAGVYRVSTTSSRPIRTEFRLTLFDGFNVGLALHIISFDLYPSVVIILGYTDVCFAFGGPLFFLKSIGFLAAGAVAGGLMSGFDFVFSRSVTLYLLSVPHIALYITIIGFLSYSRYRALRRKEGLLKRQRDLLEEANEKLEIASVSDYLTGLNNRRYLRQTIERDIALTQREYKPFVEGRRDAPPEEADIAFLLLDMDHFKTVNDNHGHDAGDAVLVGTAEILRRICRESDTLVRWGGEEFLIVARHIRREQATVLAERIRSAVEAHEFEIESRGPVRCTCSIGLAVYPFLRREPDRLNWEQVVSAADQALFLAKESQRNAWISVFPGSRTGEDFVNRLMKHELAGLISEQILRIETSIEDPSRIALPASPLRNHTIL